MGNSLKKEAVTIQTRVLMISLAFALMFYMALSMFPAAASSWQVTEVKTKDLPIAGSVTFTSSFSATDGATITIELIDSPEGYVIDHVELKKSTPSRGGEGSITIGTQTDFSVDVTVQSGGAKTLHLWLWLTSGEHVGVNVHF